MPWRTVGGSSRACTAPFALGLRFGLSLPDPSGDYTDARSRQLLLALMDPLGVARASLVGHSIGGRIAWGFAAKHPERMNKLMLVSALQRIRAPALLLWGEQDEMIPFANAADDMKAIPWSRWCRWPVWATCPTKRRRSVR